MIIQLLHASTLTTLNFYIDMVGKPMGCHMHLLPQPSTPHSFDPPDCVVLCSPIPSSTPIVNEDQAIDRVDVAQPTCIVIYNEYEWESEHQPGVRDDLLLSTPPPLFPDIFGDSVILYLPYVNSSTDTSTSDHLQNPPDAIPSFDNGEEKFFTENLLHFSSTFSKNAEGEHSLFSSTPLFDSSYHEDVDELIDFSDRSCRDLFTPIFNHDVELIIVDL